METLEETTETVNVYKHIFKCDICGATICEVEEDENGWYDTPKNIDHGKCLCDKCRKERVLI